MQHDENQHHVATDDLLALPQALTPQQKYDRCRAEREVADAIKWGVHMREIHACDLRAILEQDIDTQPVLDDRTVEIAARMLHEADPSFGRRLAKDGPTAEIVREANALLNPSRAATKQRLRSEWVPRRRVRPHARRRGAGRPGARRVASRSAGGGGDPDLADDPEPGESRCGDLAVDRQAA